MAILYTKRVESCYDCPDVVLGYEGRACCKHRSDRRYGVEYRSEPIPDYCIYERVV